MAAGLASAGADVMLVSRSAEEASEAATQIASDFGRDAIGIAADVTVPRAGAGDDRSSDRPIRQD